jgi:purine-binding chemotaxis protein CheW
MSASTGAPGVTGLEFLVFRAGSARCGVDIARVHEINRNMDVTRVFTAPAHVRGVINLRGQIVTVVDVGRRLAMESPHPPRSPKNVVVESEGELIGLLVDDIDDIVKAPPGGPLPPPRHLPEALGACAVGVLPAEDELVVLLDVDALTR